MALNPELQCFNCRKKIFTNEKQLAFPIMTASGFLDYICKHCFSILIRYLD